MRLDDVPTVSLSVTRSFPRRRPEIELSVPSFDLSTDVSQVAQNWPAAVVGTVPPEHSHSRTAAHPVLTKLIPNPLSVSIKDDMVIGFGKILVVSGLLQNVRSVAWEVKFAPEVGERQ